MFLDLYYHNTVIFLLTNGKDLSQYGIKGLLLANFDTNTCWKSYPVSKLVTHLRLHLLFEAEVLA